MIPREKELVKRLEGRPFAFLGVNSDPADAVREMCGREGIPWRNAVDGSRGGPVAARWNVKKWPTLYVLDAKGVIRFKDVRGEAIGDAVGELLGELEGERK